MLSEERGSVVIAMSVMMIMLLLGVALVTRSQSRLVAASDGSDFAAAEAAAEQGIAEAVARIDGGERGDFTGSGTVVGGAFRYSAIAADSSTYTIYAEAAVDGDVRAVEVTVEGTATDSVPHGYALFVDRRADLRGNRGKISGPIGTNGEWLVDRSLRNVPVELHGPNAVCDNCKDVTTFPQPMDLPLPVAPTGAVRSCPKSGVFTGSVDGGGGRPYVCDPADVGPDFLDFTGTVTVVNGPLVVYVLEGLEAWVRDAKVNVGGDPDDFQLFLLGDDSRAGFVGYDSTLEGVVYAPGRYGVADDFTMIGSLTLDQIAIEKNWSVSLSASPDLGGSGSTGWQVTSWERVAQR